MPNVLKQKIPQAMQPNFAVIISVVTVRIMPFAPYTP